MDLYSELSGEALTLVREHQSVLDRLPRTFLVNTLIEVRKWPTLFEPEKGYFRQLLAELSAFDAAEFQETFGSLKTFELRTGCDRATGGDLETLQLRLLDHLQRDGQYSAWRAQIDAIFQKLEPRVEARLYSSERKPRLVVMIYEEGMAVERDKLWARLREMGTQVPLKIEGAETHEPFLRALFTGQAPRGAQGNAPVAHARNAPTLFDVLRDSQGFSPRDIWVLETGDALCELCESSGKVEEKPPCATVLSYARLRGYREKLSEAIYSRVVSGAVHGPLELAAWIKTLQLTPEQETALRTDGVVTAFVRDIFLAGAGTLVINNTFVEWSAVQALKRAQPRMLVARFGVRDKMKPFSSLLLFSKPRPTDQIPNLQDPLGSFVDAELLSYYVWLNAKGVAPYRDQTLYLLLADGVDEMLAIGPSQKPAAKIEQPATLMDVAATMARWLGATLPDSPGRAIAPLVV